MTHAATRRQRHPRPRYPEIVTDAALLPAQVKYEVRFDWGTPGLLRVAPDAGVIVIVDAFGHADALSALESGNGGAVVAPSAAGVLAAEGRRFAVPVVAASLRNRRAVARWVLDHQVSTGSRVRVAVVAVGADAATPRYGVDDLLAAGAVIDALAANGIDYSSPEAAAACAAYLGLQRAAGHLFTASVAGQQLIERGLRESAVAAGKLDDSEIVPLLGGSGYAPA